jgi:hypothetical protein
MEGKKEGIKRGREEGGKVRKNGGGDERDGQNNKA